MQSREPVTIKEWVIVFILSAIPLVNVIMLFVWAFGGNANKSIENWAKASLLMFVISAVLVIAVLIIFAAFYNL